MRKVSGLIAAAGLVILTAGCVQDGYPSSGYGYSPGYYNSGYSGYYSQPAYYSRPTYYSSPSYYSSPTYYSTYSPPPRVVVRHHHHHKHGRDRNHDGIPDRYQRRW
jgi:hypothetical protein